jgi:hypothetical protein
MKYLATTNPFSGIDLLSDSRSESYFSMKDILIHYSSLRSKSYKRDFNKEVMIAIDVFFEISKSDREALHQLFTIGHPKPQKETAQRKLSDWRDRVLGSNPRYKKYFSKPDLSDSVTLKAAYKREIKIHHPDRGGTHNAAIELNDTFSQLHEQVAVEGAGINHSNDDRIEGGNVSRVWIEIPDIPIISTIWCDWLGPLAWETRPIIVDRPIDADNMLEVLRASVAVDEYELEDAVAMLRRVFRQKCSSQHSEWSRLSCALETSILLCRRLRAAHMDSEAIEVAKLARSMKLPAKFHWDSWRLADILNSDIRPQVNPLHPRQRANWERYAPQANKGTAARLKNARQSRDARFSEVIITLSGFIRLPFDPKTPCLPSTLPKKVPQPNAWTDFSPDQIAEYHFVFYEAPTLNLVNKHLKPRCDAWFDSIFHPEIRVFELLNEIHTIADFFTQSLRKTPIQHRIDSFSPRATFMDFVEFLLALSANELRQRLDILAAIDARYGADIENWLTDNFLQEPPSHRGLGRRNLKCPDIHHTFYSEKPDQLSLGGQLALNPVLMRSWRKEWFKAACAPINQLEHALATGWMVARDETIAKVWQRCNDYSVTHALTQKLWWETGARYALEAKDDKLFVHLAEDAVKMCVEHMQKTEFTEELYLGWWSENLAKALFRIDSVSEARQVAIRFFELNPRAHAWTTIQEMDYLKRLLKA